MTETLSFPGLGWEFHLSRAAFTIPIGENGITVYWYGILIALAFLSAVFYAFRRCATFGINADRAIDVVLVSAIGGILGARIYYVLFTWDYYKDNLGEIFKIWHGGIAIYGGVIGALLVGALMCKIRKVRFLPMADMAVGGILLGQAIGRWGNFVNIEAFGSNTTLPWGMTSPSIVSYLSGMKEELSKIGVEIDPSMPVHPTFFYESLWCLIGFGLAAYFAGRRRFDGELLLFYAAWYGTGRAVIEGLRTDSLMLGTIRVSQLLAILCVIASALIWIAVRSKIKSSNDPEYLKVFAKTGEAAAVVSGEYYKRLEEEKKKQPEKVAQPIKPETAANPVQETVQAVKEAGPAEMDRVQLRRRQRRKAVQRMR
ncbi:MAG: prolipoprotein diacylglyceryl transferase [Oscillospiraceae bacterium]|jgi:phosphatidylglycerol:prolipoprotein diacylglycerol transferase|nr:prolipoprotein diacylglyceryl transferase [Oscillospiraceae bacterium]